MSGSPAQRARGPFRPDIEGLRAVAVMLVLAYHARVPGIGGGYIGVDVFFVVSGFLITGLILRELETTGTVSLPTFYARRARRLLPAALVVIAATVLASAVLLPPLRVVDVASDGAASAVYLGNIRFAIQATDYLQAELAPSPLLHFWSLGVEEQFYLFWPALLLLAAGRRANPRRLALVIVAVSIASFALSLLWTSTDAPLAFFLLPARAWELGVGAILALAVGRLARLPGPVANAAVGAGLAAIALGGVVLGLDTPFPGTAALLPVGGAALVIAGGIRQPLGPGSRILATRPMQWIGGISYSLYLWHWPLLVLPAAALETRLPGVVRLALVALTFVLAVASRRWIEDPIRHGRGLSWRPGRTLAAAGAVSVVVAIVALGTGRLVGPTAVAEARTTPIELVLPTAVATPTTAGSPPPAPTGSPGATPTPTAGSTGMPATPGGAVPADLVPSLAAVRDDIPVIYADGCHATARATVPPPCAYGEVDAATTVYLVGDSHAGHWFPTLERLARERGWRFVSLTKSACPAADVVVYNTSLKREYRECAEWRAAVETRIDADRPALVFISNSRGSQLVVDGAVTPTKDAEAAWAAGLERTVRTIESSGARVVVIGDTPNPDGDPPVCLSDHPDDVLACTTPLSRALAPVHVAGERTATETAGATYIDPSPWLCPTAPCPAVIGRVLVYRDEHHMTTPFAAALAPYLESLLPAIGD
ncbi:MAG: SGNH hydrolase domain-containing protein [Candidatus Limnocylindrales bacterium]